MTKRIIHWFRRDLRLDDNTALLAAYAATDAVVPVFIFDDAILRRPDTGANRVAFLLDSLRALDADLRARGGRLIIRRGRPEDELARLVVETGAVAVYFNQDVEPFALARDARVKARLAGLCAVEGFEDGGLTAPNAIKTKAGAPYTVFTPYKNAVLNQTIPRPRPAPAILKTPADIGGLPLPTLVELGFTTTVTLPPGGEGAAQTRLREFIHTSLHRYAAERDQLAANGTSGLSPYLRFGCLSPRRAYWAARDAFPQGAAGAEVWIAELIWRDFYRQILFHFPYVETGAFKRDYGELDWENNEEWFDRWRTGRTGFPIVDAAMRQLLTTGWMHNRARMIVASFLTKDLLIDWRWGECHFMQHLVDGDLAANNGGWQWAASTGTDAQPYFRIFNPTAQGKKFDPTGAYIRRYVPELRTVPDRWIHEPSRMPPDVQRAFRCVIGDDYPAPIVDHSRQRAKALALYGRAAGGKTTRRRSIVPIAHTSNVEG
ncbi:MAG: DNA photolyase family protein [Chloracidobacterium sp.]|nr:DNA photolyase family protein [Chloracidobacterium sp.]MDW8216790.1 deoxyribodipyrimidine photo-lyase [Acidobacteriota bacterium]